MSPLRVGDLTVEVRRSGRRKSVGLTVERDGRVVLAAPEGIKHLESTGMNLHIITASIDSHLNEHAFIVPGLGDAGDRQFGPPN